MMPRFLCETSLDGYRALSVGRHLVHDSWDQVHAFLDGTLGSAHAAVFAEPHTGHGVVAWMTTTASDPVPVADLPEEERTAALDRLRALMDDIAAVADAKAASPKMEDQRWAALLRALLSVPTSRDLADILYVADGQPVLVQWGTRDENATISTALLSDKIAAALAAPPRAPQEVPQPAAVVGSGPVVLDDRARGLGWLWALLLWLLFALLLAAIYWRLLLACVVSLPFGAAGTCEPPGAVTATLAAPTEERGDLERTLEALRGGIAQSPQCQVETAALPPLVPEAGPEPGPQQATDLDRARERTGGQVGDVTLTLLWNGRSDLDLIVGCPDGNELVGWRPPVCGGEIDVDANRCNQRNGVVCAAYHGTPVQDPVENAFFLKEGAIPGTYRVWVRNFAAAEEAPAADVPFALQIRQGEDVQVLRGSVRNGESAEMTSFTME